MIGRGRHHRLRPRSTGTFGAASCLALWWRDATGGRAGVHPEQIGLVILVLGQPDVRSFRRRQSAPGFAFFSESGKVHAHSAGRVVLHGRSRLPGPTDDSFRFLRVVPDSVNG